MKEKKGLVIGIIVAVIVLILAILIVPTVRKVLMLKSITEKVEEIDKNVKNVHVKTTAGDDVAETYFMDNKQKAWLNGKLLGENEGKGFSFNFGYYSTFWDTFQRAKDMKIKTIKEDGKEYYEITENYENAKYETDVQEAVMYVEKDTGLKTKEIRTLKDGKGTLTITHKIEFDVVTEEDFAEE